MIDIVYSVSAHECEECLLDMVENILYFNRKYNVLIICNLSKELESIVNKSKFPDKCIFHSVSTNKAKYTYDILGAHVDNFLECEKLNIKFKHYCILTSNMMFFRDMELESINSIFDSGWYHDSSIEGNRNAHMNNMIFSIGNILDFYKNEIKLYETHIFHEGAFYTFEEFKKIKNFLITSSIHTCERKNYVAEETILPILEINFFGKLNKRLGFVCADVTYLKTIEVVKRRNCFMVKPVPRIIQCEFRKYLKSLMY